jgi:putative salt-induced outer membrane protein YdiY
MSLAVNVGPEEGQRKDRLFAQRRKEEEKAYKELHYQYLITENLKLKDALKLAKGDIEDWIYSLGESPQSTKVLDIIKGLI